MNFNMNLLECAWSFIGALVFLFLVFFNIILKRQAQVIIKLSQFSKYSETALKRFESVIRELRQANLFLSELAAVEWTDELSDNPIEERQIPRLSEKSLASNQNDDDFDEQNLAGTNEHKLYVGNIDYAITESELAAHFSAYGTVKGANIPVNRYNGRARGFGFVTFVSREEAEKAIVLNGTSFKGRQIQVNFAKERESNL